MTDRDQHTDPLDVQIGGDHYKRMRIQPVELILRHRLGFCEGNVVKYVCRRKGDRLLEDLGKAAHYLEIRLAHGDQQPPRAGYREVPADVLEFIEENELGYTEGVVVQSVVMGELGTALDFLRRRIDRLEDATRSTRSSSPAAEVPAPPKPQGPPLEEIPSLAAIPRRRPPRIPEAR